MPRRKGTKNTSAIIIQEIINKHKQGATIRELVLFLCCLHNMGQFIMGRLFYVPVKKRESSGLLSCFLTPEQGNYTIYTILN